jgi:hypothetical protein
MVTAAAIAAALAFSASANRDGKAASTGNPNPALSESPRTTILIGRSAPTPATGISEKANATSRPVAKP